MKNRQGQIDWHWWLIWIPLLVLLVVLSYMIFKGNTASGGFFEKYLEPFFGTICFLPLASGKKLGKRAVSPKLIAYLIIALVAVGISLYIIKIGISGGISNIFSALFDMFS